MSKNLKQQIEFCLQNYEETRNSDIVLTIKVWERFYPQYIKTGSGGQKGVWLDDLHRLPREDNVKRVRAQFNADGKYYPTDYKVIKQRKLSEDKWRMDNGYPPRDQVKGLSDKNLSYAQKIVEAKEGRKIYKLC